MGCSGCVTNAVKEAGECWRRNVVDKHGAELRVDERCGVGVGGVGDWWVMGGGGHLQPP